MVFVSSHKSLPGQQNSSQLIKTELFPYERPAMCMAVQKTGISFTKWSFQFNKNIFYLIHMNIQNASILKDRKKKSRNKLIYIGRKSVFTLWPWIY